MTTHPVLLWLYVLNATLLIAHEVDSAYWKEWRLFWGLLGPRQQPLPDRVGAPLFVLLHLPIVGAVLWGLLEVARHTTAGLVMSLALGASGLFAWTVHTLFIRAGHPEFRTAVSQAVLWGSLAVSGAQLVAASAALMG